MRRNRQVNIRLSAAEEAMIRHAVEASGRHGSVSDLVRSAAVEYADAVLEEMVRLGPSADVDPAVVAGKASREKVEA